MYPAFRGQKSSGHADFVEKQFMDRQNKQFLMRKFNVFCS